MPCGPINDLAEVFADPQVRARGMTVDLPPRRPITCAGRQPDEVLGHAGAVPAATAAARRAHRRGAARSWTGTRRSPHCAPPACCEPAAHLHTPEGAGNPARPLALSSRGPKPRLRLADMSDIDRPGSAGSARSHPRPGRRRRRDRAASGIAFVAEIGAATATPLTSALERIHTSSPAARSTALACALLRDEVEGAPGRHDRPADRTLRLRPPAPVARAAAAGRHARGHAGAPPSRDAVARHRARRR